MPIVTCPDCGHKVSDSAITCPYCGFPYEKTKNIYLTARKRMNEAITSSEMLGVAEIFDSISGFQDSDTLTQVCRDKAKELPATNNSTVQKEILKKEGSRNPFLYAALFTICAVIIVGASFADGYFNYSYASNSLSGGTRYNDSNFAMLIGGIPIANLIILVLLASVLLGTLLAWITVAKNYHLEIYCVIASAVVLAIILICSIIGPIVFTEHNNFGFGFYFYKDFEGFSTAFYIQVASAICLFAISIISRLKNNGE